jgi:proteasome accessory factor A
MIDLQYHDIRPSRGLYYRAQAAGGAERMVGDDEIQRAVEEAPASTRAALRGRFIRRAKERRRDYTVDWVHLKVNDQAQRTVMCKDPFRSSDERVERLIASL